MKQSNAKLVRALFWIGGILGGLVLVYAVLTGVMRARMGDVSSELDYSTRLPSANGLYIVSYEPSTGTVPLNQIHQWTLHIETADGQPVEDASISVDGDMPQHGHGLPTRPQVTQNLGGGDYLVEGMKFQMGGWWVMDFTITADGQTDAVRFNMMLQ